MLFVFLKYVFIERRDVLDKMVTHCYRKSISDTLSKLLHFENFLQNDPLDEETKNEMVETRNYLLQDIFDSKETVKIQSINILSIVLKYDSICIAMLYVTRTKRSVALNIISDKCFSCFFTVCKSIRHKSRLILVWINRIVL